MDKKKLAFFIFGLITATLPKILVCIAASYSLELSKEDPKVCSKLKNNIHPNIKCSPKDIANELTLYNLKKISSKHLYNMSLACIILAVISIVMLLILHISIYIATKNRFFDWLNTHKQNRGLQHDLVMGIFIIAFASYIISSILLYACLNYMNYVKDYMGLFQNYKKIKDYKPIFVAAIVLDLSFGIIGTIILNICY